MTSRSIEFCICSHRVVTPQGVREAAILIGNGRIIDVVDLDQIPSGVPIEDMGDLVVMPGLVDSHVHINEPGRTEWEGFETATMAAAAGGVTTVVDMPLNSTPVTTTLLAFKEKLAAAEGKLWVDCGFYAGLIPANAYELQQVVEAGVLGVKAFLIHSGIDDFSSVSENDLRTAMPIIAKSGVPLLVHAEVRSPDVIGKNNRSDEMLPFIRHDNNTRNYKSYLASRPREWECDAIELLIRLCREYNCRTHIVHLSSADAMSSLQKARESGLPLTVETCPHYLYFCAEEIPDGDTRFKCAPPIRENENRERLWRALKEGVIDFIASDHSPCVPELKLLGSGDFQKAWGGISSLQFGLSIVWTEARQRGFSLSEVAAWMCHRPAQFLGLDGTKGAIASNYDADVVVWNPEEKFTVEPSMIRHRHKITPYEGRTLYGKVEMTFLRGNKIFENGRFMDGPSGKILLRRFNNVTLSPNFVEAKSLPFKLDSSSDRKG